MFMLALFTIDIPLAITMRGLSKRAKFKFEYLSGGEQPYTFLLFRRHVPKNSFRREAGTQVPKFN